MESIIIIITNQFVNDSKQFSSHSFRYIIMVRYINTLIVQRRRSAIRAFHLILRSFYFFFPSYFRFMFDSMEKDNGSD